MTSRWFLIHLLCLLHPLNAAPVTERPNPESCSEVCSGDTDLVDFGVFKSHVYSVRINHRITSPLSATGHINYVINGTAEILGGTDCNYELRLKDITVTETDASGSELLQDKHGRLLEANILRFAYDNGAVTALCPSESETAFAQNVKVAILSHIQVTMNSFQLPSLVIEEDISGRCLTRYFPEPSTEGADAWTIRRVKSTAGCANKYSRKTRFDGIDLGLAQDASNSMVLDGAQTCTITLPAGGTVSHAECSENMTVSGLVRGNLTTINTVSVNTVLHLISSDTGATLSSGSEESIRRIAFGHTAVFADADPKAADLVEASQTLAAVLVSDFTDRATSFAKLIRLIRRMEPDQLEELYNIYKDTQQAKDLLSEAVYSAGTQTALNHLKNVIKEGRLSTPILQLSMLPSPTLGQIETIRKVLHSTDVKSLALVISTLVDRYCQSHPRCLQDEIILKSLRQLESTLGHDCSTNFREARDEVISTLRAIGNSGRVSNTADVYPVLERCLRQPDIFVRSAAAEAFRKFPCDEKSNEILKEVFMKHEEEAEVRIHAYLSWSRCLTKEGLLSLLSTLREDPSDQVKSFVTSHLMSIKNSQDPFKADKRRMLESLQVNLGDIHDYAGADFRRHSMYFDKHYYAGQFGGGVESTIIYGPTSPLPRHASLNVTFRGFGRSFNLLEFGYRSEFGGKLRRALLDEPKDMPRAEDVGAFPYPAKDYKFFRESERRTSAFVRLFGHEVFHSMDVEEDFKGLHPDNEVQASLVEVDEVISLPTVGGLSLQVAMLGVSSHKLKYELKLTQVVLDINARLDWPLFPNPIYFLLGGTKPNQKIFKYERSIQEIGHRGPTPLRSDEFGHTSISRTPALLDKILGLSAVVSKRCNALFDLCPGFSLEVEKYDGLGIFFRRGPLNYIELRCGHPGTLRTLVEMGNVISLSYEPHSGGTSRLTFRSRFPWDIEYGFRGHYNESEFDGLLTFGAWNARLNGSLVAPSSDEWKMQSHLSSFDRGVKLSYRKMGPRGYHLLLENTGRLLPFYLLSFNDYGCSDDSVNCENAWNHTSVLKMKNAGIELRMHSQDGTCKTSDVEFSLYWDAHDQKKATAFSFRSERCRLTEANASYVPLHNSSLSLLHKRGEETECQLTAGALTTGSILSQRLTVNSSHWLDISKLALFLDPQQKNFGGISAKVDGFLVLSNWTLGSMTLSDWHQVVLEDLSINATYTADSKPTYALRSRLIASEKRYTVVLASAQSEEIEVDTKYASEIGQNILFDFNSSIQVNKSEVYSVKNRLLVDSVEKAIGLQYSFEEISDNASLPLASARIQTPYRWQLPLNCSLSVIIPLTLKQSQFAASSELFVSSKSVSFGLAAWNQSFLTPARRRGFTTGFKHNFESVRVFDADGHLEVYPDPTVNKPHSLKLNLRQEAGAMRLYAIRAETSAGGEANARLQQEEDKISLLFALKPAVQTEAFKGLFYKSTSRYSRAPFEFILTHSGEWNANQGFAPGMPFRYGLEYTHTLDFSTGQVYAYADDSLLGKVTHMELVELMYDYSFEGARKQGHVAAYQFNSEGMLNWRRHLGRGTVGSHGTLNANISRDLCAGNLELIAELPDRNQSHLRLLLDYSKGHSKSSLTADAYLTGQPIYGLNATLLRDERGQFDFVGRLKTPTDYSPLLELQLMRGPVCDCYSCCRHSKDKRLVGSLNSSLALLPNLTVRYEANWDGRTLTGHLSYQNTTYVEAVIGSDNNNNNLGARILSTNPILPIKANISSTFSPYESMPRLDGDIQLPKQNITVKFSNCSLQRRPAEARFGGDILLHTGFLNWTRVHLSQSVLLHQTDKRVGLSVTALGLREGSRFFDLEFNDTSLPNAKLALFTHLPRSFFGFSMFDLLLMKEANENATQVNVSGHFYSLPVLLNSELKLHLVESLFIWSRPRLIPLIRLPPRQLFDVILNCTTSDDKRHTANISWHFAKATVQRDAVYALNSSALLKSDYLPQKEISFSLSQPFGWYPSLRGSLRSGQVHNFSYTLNCSSFFLSPKCLLLVENLSPNSRNFEKAEVSLMRPDADGPIHFGVTIDEKHTAIVELLYTSRRQKPTLLFVNSSLHINGTPVFDTTTTFRQSTLGSNYSVLLESSKKWVTSAGQKSQLSVRLLVDKADDASKASVGLALTTATNASNTTTIGGDISCLMSENLSYLEWQVKPLSSGRVDFSSRTYETAVSLNLTNTLLSSPLSVKGRTNIFYLLKAIQTRDFQPPDKAYFLDFQNSRISLALQTDPEVDFTLLCRLLDFNQSLAFKTAFALANTRDHKRLKLALDVDKPQDAKLLVDWSLRSNKTQNIGVTNVSTGIAFGTLIPKIVATVFVQPLGRSQPLHLKLALESRSAVLDASLHSHPNGSKHEVRVSFESPQNSKSLVPFVLTGQCGPRLTLETPCEVIYRTTTREACVGVRRTLLGISSEVAWNRLRNGTLQVHFNDSTWTLQTPQRALTVGWRYTLSEDDAISYFLQLSPQDQGAADYIEVYRGRPGQMAIRSTWLKSPIGANWEIGGGNFSFSLYAGAADMKTQDLITMTFTAGQDGRGYLFFKNVQNTCTAHTSLQATESKGIRLLMNFTLNDKNGTATLEYLPQKRFFASFTDQAHVEVLTDQRPERLIFNFTNILLGGEIQANGNLVFLREPLSLFAKVRSITSEGLLRFDMKDYLNVDAEILHSSMQGPKVLDARLATRLDNTNLYSLSLFWRPEAVSEMLTDGLKNFTQYGLDSAVVKLLDPVFLITEGEITKIWELVNHSAVYESYTAITEDAAIIQDTLSAFQKDGYCLVGLVENFTLSSVEYLKHALSANVMSSAYQAIYDSVIREIHKVDELMQNLLNTTQNAAAFVRTMNATGSFGQRMFRHFWNGVQNLCEASSRSFGVFSQSLHSLGTTLANTSRNVAAIVARQVANDLEDISKAFSKERTELMEAVHSVALRTKDGLSYLLSLLVSQNAVAALQETVVGNISGAFREYVKPEDSLYEVDWGALSVNASIHIPQEVLQATSLPIAFYGGMTLQPSTWPQRVLQISRPVLREFAVADVWTKLRNAPVNITKSLKYDAWLFLTPQLTPRIIRFDGKILPINLYKDSQYMLVKDTLEDSIALTLSTHRDDFELRLVYDGEEYKIGRSGSITVSFRKGVFWEPSPVEKSMTVEGDTRWWLKLTDQQVTMAYDMFHEVLWVRFGPKWFGRLNGHFGSTFDSLVPSWELDIETAAAWFESYKFCNREINVGPFLTLIRLEENSKFQEITCSSLAAYAMACDGAKGKKFVDDRCRGQRTPRYYNEYWHYGRRYRGSWGPYL
nr:unnamed protein product [Spirometra erinaceieuropaei]